jgi:hypothetical protein
VDTTSKSLDGLRIETNDLAQIKVSIMRLFGSKDEGLPSPNPQFKNQPTSDEMLVSEYENEVNIQKGLWVFLVWKIEIARDPTNIHDHAISPETSNSNIDDHHEATNGYESETIKINDFDVNQINRASNGEQDKRIEAEASDRLSDTFCILPSNPVGSLSAEFEASEQINIEEKNQFAMHSVQAEAESSQNNSSKPTNPIIRTIDLKLIDFKPNEAEAVQADREPTEHIESSEPTNHEINIPVVKLESEPEQIKADVRAVAESPIEIGNRHDNLEIAPDAAIIVAIDEQICSQDFMELPLNNSEMQEADLDVQSASAVLNDNLINDINSLNIESNTIDNLLDTLNSSKSEREDLKQAEKPEAAKQNSRYLEVKSEYDAFTDEQRALGYLAPVWIPDNDAVECMKCNLKFTLLKRRHHCRGKSWVLCGLVLIDNDT